MERDLTFRKLTVNHEAVYAVVVYTCTLSETALKDFFHQCRS